MALKILVNINNPRHIKIADWLQKKLTAFGVEIHIIKEPANIFVNYSVKKAKFDSIALLSAKANKRILWDFHTQNIMKKSGQQGIVNFSRLKSKKLDGLLDMVHNDSLTLSSQNIFLQKVYDFYEQEVIVIPLLFRAKTSIFHKEIKEPSKLHFVKRFFG